MSELHPKWNRTELYFAIAGAASRFEKTFAIPLLYIWLKHRYRFPLLFLFICIIHNKCRRV